jgi:branched-chain amino acid transport system substrate-binding protein
MAEMSRREVLRAGMAATVSAAAGLGFPAVLRAQGKPLKVGLLLPYSKVYAVLGESITNGMRVVFEAEGNRVAGRPVELLREDTEVSPPVALRKLRKFLTSDQVDFVVGPVSSAVAAAIRDPIHHARVILLNANAGDNALTRERCSPYIFRTSFSNWQTSYGLGAWAKQHLGPTAYLSGSDYAAGYQIVGAFKESFMAAGGTVVGEAYVKLGSTDYAATMAQIGAAAPALSFSFFAGSDAVHFVKQFAEFGLKGRVRLTGAGFLVSDDVLESQGEAAVGAIGTLHYSRTLGNPQNLEFRKRYQALAGKTPDVYAVQGYDTARVIVEALRITGGDTADPDRLSRAIRGIQFDSPRGRFRFDPATHNVINDMYVLEVRRGEEGLANYVVGVVKDLKDPGHCPNAAA